MKKALIVDDTKNIRIMLQKCLELEGYTVETAVNGLEGLNMILENTYTLIFMDIKMPELSGTEVLRRMRSNGINTPVIIITAYPTIKNAVDCTHLGAIAYLQKPFTMDRLKNTLDELESSIKQVNIANGETYEVTELIAHNKYKEAIYVLSKKFEQNPSDYKIYLLLSELYKKNCDMEQSARFRKIAAYLKKSLEQNSDEI